MVNPAEGTILKVTISAVLTAVAQITDLDGPSGEVGTAETTHLTSGQHKTFRPTLTDGGEVSGTLLYDPGDATHTFLFGLLGTPATPVWNMVFNDADDTAFAFAGILTKFSPTGIKVEENLQATFSIKVSGAVTVS